MTKRTGSRLAPSVAVETALYSEIRNLVSAMFDVTDNGLKRERLHVVRGNVATTFRSEGRRITRDFINRVVRLTEKSFKGAVKGMSVKPVSVLHDRDSVRRMEKCWKMCEGAIVDIPRKFYRKLDDAIRQYNDGGVTKRWFDNRYRSIKWQTLRRAHVIARCENGRATEAMFLSRCAESGVTKVMWCHTHLPEKKPRDYHLRRWDGHSGKRNGKPNGLNGYVFDIEKPPVIDLKTGERGYPAQLINCRCYLVPVSEET